MSGNNLDANDEFDEQLRMQELYGDTKDGDTQNDPSGEPDSFGQQPADTPYEWDLDKKAWFPKITEDFIATYQANYGFSNDGASSSTANVQDANTRTVEEPPQRKTPEPADPKKKGEKRKAESGWFHVEEDRNTNVYVSGLPPDITVDEFIQLMSKFGIIMRDPQTEEFKVKLYKDNQGNLKGDGLCCYLKRESVELALKLLDEDEIRGYKLHVEVAKFQLKGEYDASKKKKKCKDYKKKLSLQQKQLDWRPERRAGPSRMRHERVVIIKNMFHPMDFEDDPLVLNEIREDLRVECSKFGQIRKLLLFDRHPDGVASVSFRDPEEADHCIQTLDGRWFGGRQITAQAWDGTTDYQVEETSREREERLRGWEAFLNAPEANRGLQRSNSVCAPERAGPSRIRHFSEHPSTSKMNAQEAATGVAFEEPIDEKKFEKTEAGEEVEEGASGKDAKEGGPEEEIKEDFTEKESEESCLERECEGGCPKREYEEDCPEKDAEGDSPKKELKENGPERESKKKKLKHDYEENGLAKESEDDDPGKESEEEGSPKKESGEDDSERESDEDGSEKQSEEGSEKEFEENGLENDFDEDGSDKEFPENLLDKELEENDTDKSEFDEGSERVLDDEEGSEREFDEDSDEKEEEEDMYEKVFDDESDEKEDEEFANEKEREDAIEKEDDDDADEKLFEDSDEKEDEEDADLKEDEDGDEKVFEDGNSNEKFDEEEGSNEKVFDDSDERGTLGNMKEDGLSTGSSFVLSSDDDDDDI
ncbi:HIV Tat-specific factor 1 [Sciurus carolinensis]|uniref:HIV Tat-specific factor 1 n=1 Tax=Sciurus carolinensis TaxID=30640 RepID=UPI001FB4CBB8|nr:HIV Tat-specific factor 1 [Sciurus carolinensis]XP_047392904.1 HIV Tat-specific factor 1 [Sciurus carolinensis]XP_047392905.1 HIV Tat-specific factor 1 [Sciurus carolinensis]XP_047392906.1 HIV Tat-specific factor 1 [Sciurus carolinensis]XP_047392907.1 HIV Tat-specific factor 1 [Sciurus carolinensis]XP_047392908.1 HIV Tat-specific factor 1 [Sciurus carolinensis]